MRQLVLSHSTADYIMEHDWNGPLYLYRGKYPLIEEWESLIWYVEREARLHKIRLKLTIKNGTVIVRKVS